KLSDNDILFLERIYRLKKVFNKINIRDIINNIRNKRNKIEDIIKPRQYQEDIINKSIKYFQNNNKGILCLICGIGKTLISLWITQRLNFNKILIGVPNKLLLEQWKININKLFNIPY